ncbi:unnamed protein product [Camellia sinensis]
MRETEKAEPTTSQNQKPKKNPQLQRSGKKPNSKIALKPKPSTGWGLTSGCCRSVDSTSAVSVNDFKHKKKMMVDDVDESGETSNPLTLSDFTTGFVENTSTTTPVCKLAACVPVLGCEFEFEFEFDDKLMKDDSTAIAIAATTTTTTTPPVEASVSPEIQCGSSLLVSSATPACYGAGHIISGVTDRRKCRARGLLTVGKNDSNFGKSNISNNADDDIEIPSKSGMSLAPLPVEASVHWLLSPCHDEDGDHETDTENGLQPLRKSLGFASASSPLSSGHRISSDLCNIFYSSSTTSGSCSKRKTRVTLLSPSGNPTLSVSPHATPTSEAIISQEQRKPRYDLSGENSPFSIESLGSGNVIQTPQSDLSSDRRVGLFWLNEHDHQINDFGSGRDSVAGIASLSPKNQTSIWDPLGLSFQFSDLISPSNSIDFPQLPNTGDNHASCISISTLEDISCSPMRISWRDGLVSRIFEMDEFNCCRCLSDDENDVRECSNGKSKSSPSHDLNIDVGNAAILSNGFEFPVVVGHESKSDEEGKQKFHMQRSNSCAESICIEGGELVASGDSDWTVCYKNQLFQL